jgi:anti-sigma factor RsiW
MCPNLDQVHAYHDGELSQEQRAAFEAHLQTCRECHALLDELNRLTRLLAQVSLAELPPRAMGRLYGAFNASRVQQDRGVRKLAGWMTAAAAAVLAVAFVRHPNVTKPPDEQPAGTWPEMVAVMPPLQPSNGSNAELVQFAQWTASDLSIGDSRQ